MLGLLVAEDDDLCHLQRVRAFELNPDILSGDTDRVDSGWPPSSCIEVEFSDRIVIAQLGEATSGHRAVRHKHRVVGESSDAAGVGTVPDLNF